MKSLVSTITLAAVLASAAAASAESVAPAQLPGTPGTRLVLIDASSGKTIAEYVAILVKGPAPAVVLPAPDVKRAFADVAPLTIQQENDFAAHVLESQGPPLHTP